MKKLDFFKISFVIRKVRLQDGFAPIYLQLFLDSQRARISINQKIEVDLWDDVHGRMKGKNAKASYTNEYLDKLKLDTMRVFNDLKLYDEEITVDVLREKLTGSKELARKKLHEIAQMYNSQTNKLICIELNQHTWDRYKTYAKRLSDFIKLKFKSGDIYLFQLKYYFIAEYEFYLKTQIKVHQNNIVK